MGGYRLSEFPLVFVRNFTGQLNEAVMIDGGPLHGGASAKLVIDYESTRTYYVKDRLKSVVGIAFIPEDGREAQFQLVNTQYGGLPQILNNLDLVGCCTLPVFIFRRKDDPATDAAPKPVG